MTPEEVRRVLGLPPPVVYPPRAPIDREALTKAALAKLTPEQHALGEAVAAKHREAAAWQRFRARILGPMRGEGSPC